MRTPNLWQRITHVLALAFNQAWCFFDGHILNDKTEPVGSAMRTCTRCNYREHKDWAKSRLSPWNGLK